MKKKVVYIEPVDYFSKETRKKYKLGEFAEENVEAEIAVTVETKNYTLKAEGIEAVEKLIEVLKNKTISEEWNK